ncbi:MAG: glycosyltransferase family 4 protein [Actinobacteria bacterium]|nr:glycosyltransferase family 4 protein [Cyanobacteriota bacterium]MCL5771849.1 glycosyltransferase family 4 protein [Actinomycetota bacterium]
MKIAIDATIVRKENTGTGFYIINLLNGLLKKDNKNEYIVFIDGNVANKLLKIKKDNFKIINKNFRYKFSRILWQLFLLPIVLKKNKVDVLHSSNYVTPLYKLGFKIIVTIHDLTFLLFPEKYTIMKRLFYKIMIPFFVKVSDKIIAISNNTKTDILKYFKLNDDKVTIVYACCSENFNNIVDEIKAKEVLLKYEIKKDYMLFVGMIEPRKNIISILRAFKEIDKDINADLIIAGKKGWYFKEIEEFMKNVKNMDLKNNIIFTGYVPEEDMKYLFQKALFFIFPSFYEGFGLPPLQAMACGTPVITSNISSLPEVVGKAAILINPYDLHDLSESMKFLYFNSEKRKELSNLGLEQCKKFNIDNIAINVIKIFESLA